jgi:cbb3-type cytochrome oxidase maturation protein
MSVIYIVLPLAIVLAIVALGAFIWAVRRGQYDDMDTPSVRMLHDDEPAPPKGSASSQKDA